MYCRTHLLAAVSSTLAVYGLWSGAARAQTTVAFQEGATNQFGTYTGTLDNELFGYSGSLFDFNNGAGASLQWGTEVIGQQRRIIMRFENLQAPTGASVVTAASIQLYKADGVITSRPPFTVQAFRIADANAGWNEGDKAIEDQMAGDAGSDWSHRDHAAGTVWAGSSGLNTPGTDYIEPAMDAVTVDPADPPETTYEWDLDPLLVQQWVDGGVNAGFLLVGAEDVNLTAMPIISRNNTSAPDRRPALVIRFEAVEASFDAVQLGDTFAQEFLSETGKTYMLEYTTEPGVGDWVPTGAALAGDGQAMQFFDPTGYSTSKTYRILFQ